VIRWALSTRIADLLGRSSYAFYLIHLAPVLNILLTGLIVVGGLFGARAASGFENLLLNNVAFLFLIVTLLSIALYKGIEAPANQFLRRRFGTTGRTAPVSQVGTSPVGET
jgi:peptidoglycan/LPS O-acetylase OafA/YrhL